MPDLQSVYEEYKDKVDFIAIDCGESKETIEGYLVEEKGAYTFPIGYDENETITESFGIDGFPTTLVLDKNKKIVDIIEGGADAKRFKMAIEKALK